MKVIDFLQFLFKFSISKNQLIRDITVLRNDIRPLKDKLIPFNDEEMELLSLNKSNFSKKKGLVKFTKGIFDTIFYENLIAYGIREYSNKQKLILITSSSDEFVYVVKSDKTHVYMNNSEAGVILNDGKFYSLRNKLLGTIDGNDSIASHNVIIQNRQVGFISNPRIESNTVPRAFSFLKSMNMDERTIFLCLTLINLVEESELSKTM
ncbi:MAG: hypothetical protein IPL55_05965 [Saprospiraceae bacterium]|jgi:hypothetical protein|nr:hypothetical protein [Saprospiraceae bacterium]MBL0026127.1 hypothetical protein [Saprospiraceae bacterium]